MTTDTRQQIIDTAIEFFLEKGLLNVSFNALIRATGLSKGGVYHYFANKEELILAIYEHFLKDFFDAEQQQNSKSAWHKLQHWISNGIQVASDLSAYRKLFIDLFYYAACSEVAKQKNIESYNHFHHFIVTLLEQAKQDGDVKADTQSGLMANALIGICDGIDAAACILGEEHLNSKQAISYGLYLLLNSVATEQGRENIITVTRAAAQI